MSSILPIPVYRWSANSGQLQHPYSALYRTTPGWYIDRNGIMRCAPSYTPRISYAGNTGIRRGLQMETTCTPLNAYSEQFDNPQYSKAECFIATKATLGPNGVDYADKIVSKIDTNLVHYMMLYCTTTLSDNHTAVWIIKPSEIYNFHFNIRNNDASTNMVRCNFNTSTDTISGYATGTAAFGHCGREWIGNNWCIVWLSGIVDPAVSSGTLASQIIMLDGNNSGFWDGDGVSGFFLGGFNVYDSPVAHSYVRTGWRTTSSQALTIATGAISSIPIGYDADKPEQAIPVGAQITLTANDVSNGTMTGTVTAHSDTALSVNITSITGSGTGSDWTVQAGLVSSRTYEAFSYPLNILQDQYGNPLYNGGPFSFVIRGRTARGVAAQQGLAAIQDASSNACVLIYRDINKYFRIATQNCSTPVNVPFGGAMADDTDFAIAVSFETSDVRVHQNGVYGGQVTSADIPAMFASTFKLIIGGSVSSGTMFDGWINSFEFYSGPLTNDMMAALSVY